VREGWSRADATEMSRYILQNTYGNLSVARRTMIETKSRMYEDQGNVGDPPCC